MIGVVLYGQLGNQMFQYAAARYLAKQRNTSVLSVGPRSSWRGTLSRFISPKGLARHPDSGEHNGVLHRALGYGGTQLTLGALGKTRSLIDRIAFARTYEPEVVISESGAFIEHFNSDFMSLSDRTLLSGWFQSSKYWNEDRQFAQDLFRPSPSVDDAKKVIETQSGVDFNDVIGLHVRRGDYLQMRHGLSESQSGWALPMDYYTSAISQFEADRRILVFADDPDWATEQFTDSRFIVQPKRTAITDLHLMSLCKHKIIANSSFSWWAAYLGDTPDGITIAPEHHLGWKIGMWVPADIQQNQWSYMSALNASGPNSSSLRAKKAESESAMKPPPVSILIPCYNADEWLAQAIESALAQDTEVEVIVYNDGSTDDSDAVARSFGDRIKYIAAENKGAPVARNVLLETAKHDWVQYLDADDYLLPDKVSRQLKYVIEHPNVDVCFSPVWVEWQDGSSRNADLSLDRSPIPEPHDPWQLLALWRLPQTGGPLWRKSAIQDVGGWKEDQPCCQEHELYLRLLKNKKRFLHTPEGGAIYRRFEDGTVSTKNMHLVWTERFKIERQIESYLEAKGLLSPDRQWAVNQARFEMARNAWPVDRKLARTIHASIKQRKTKFSPSSPAAPPHYQRMYALVGFQASEHLASILRTFSRMVGR